MSQKDYNIRIVEALLRGESHVRGLAKLLDTNQTTIARKAKGLYQGNIVDFKKEGKNKVFYMKKSLEARKYAQVVELHRMLEALKRYPSLRRVFEQVSRNGKIRLAVLFGSYAKSSANKGSDIDIYIDTKDARLKDEVEAIDSKISVKIGEYDKDSLLIKEIEKAHIIIKGIEAFYEKNNVLD